MAKTRAGEAIGAWGRSRWAKKALFDLREESRRAGDVRAWQRATAVWGYLRGKSVISLSATFGIPRGSINRWLQWYEADGAEGLRTLKQPGRAPSLTEIQRLELAAVIDAGPVAAGYQTGIWTGPMIGDLIQQKFGVRYHNHHVPRLLHRLGFSVQRPRKKLSKADSEKQKRWLRYRLPAIKKKQRAVGASFSSRTRRASGSMERSTAPGPA